MPNVEYETNTTISTSSEIDLLMINATFDIFNAFAKLDEYIDMLFLHIYPAHIKNTSLGKKRQGIELREYFCNSVPGEGIYFL